MHRHYQLLEDEENFLWETLSADLSETEKVDSPSSSSKFRIEDPLKSHLSDASKNHFAKLFEDAMNSSDPQYLKQILSAIFQPDVSIFPSRYNREKRTTEKLGQGASGFDDVCSFFANNMIAVPDSVFLIHEWRIFPRAHKQNCLCFKFSFTGTKVYNMKLSCHVDELEKSLNHLELKSHSGDDLSAGPLDVFSNEFEHFQFESEAPSSPSQAHTIKFREMSRTSKYDSRKRRKQFTIGEYVNSNKMSDQHVPDIHDEMDDTQSVEGKMSDDGSRVTSNESLGSEDTHTIYENGRKKKIMNEASKVNITGVMRFHIDETEKVIRITCVNIDGL